MIGFKFRKGSINAAKVLKMQERFCKLVGKVFVCSRVSL
jgi:hypothetical protein